MARPRGSRKATPSKIGSRQVRSCGYMVYVCIRSSCLLPLLIFSSMVSRIRKKCALVCVTSVLVVYSSGALTLSSVRQSSKRFGTFVKLDCLRSPSFISISEMVQSRIPAACYLLSLSSSPIVPTISAKFSLNSIQPTIADLSSPARMRLWSA